MCVCVRERCDGIGPSARALRNVQYIRRPGPDDLARRCGYPVPRGQRIGHVKNRQCPPPVFIAVRRGLDGASAAVS